MNKTYYTVDLGMIFHIKTGLFVMAFLAIFCVHSGAQQVIKIGKGNTAKDILILPASYDVEKGFDDLGKAKSGHQPHHKNSGFMPQLEKAAANAVKEGGNVFRIVRIEDKKQKGIYRFWGEAYHTNEFEQIKQKAADKEKKKFDEGPYAYITIYRPAYSMGFNDDTQYDIIINDTLKLGMWANTRYILKVAKAGNVKVTIDVHNFMQNMNIDVKPGNNYYVRSYANFPGTGKNVKTGDAQVRVHAYTPYLEKIDEQQGVIESSMITQIIVSRKI